MSDVGAQNTSSSNTSTFVSALILGLVVASVYMIVFFLLHAKKKHIYQPRTILAPQSKRPSPLPTSVFGWFGGIIRAPDIDVFTQNGPDAYFFVRFMRTMVILLLPYWLITWAVLFPINAVSPNNGQPGLNVLTFGNVSMRLRWIAHMVVCVVLTVYTWYIIYNEYKHFLSVRQAYLNSPAHAALARSRTVIINNLPLEHASAERMRDLASFVPGQMEQVWLPREVKPMEKIYDARNKECTILEKAETKVQALAAKRVSKGKVQPPAAADTEQGDLISRYIKPKKRPSHKIGTLASFSLGLLGKKVDTLTYSPQFIREQTELLQKEREGLDGHKLANSAFVRFTKQNDAHLFAMRLKQETKLKAISVGTEVVPEDVIWGNLNMSPSMRMIRTAISWAATIGLIIIWLPIVAFVGVVSNITTVCSTISFLSWICKLPKAVVGIIQGILPPVLLAVVFMLLPMVLRALVKMQGEPRKSDVERKLFSRWWLFQVIHGFLIVALASGLISALSNIANSVSELPNELATKLPQSSIFFLTFILTVTLSTAAKNFSRAIPFIMSKLAFILRGSTPRAAFKYDFNMSSLALSITWPPICLLGVIGIVYSVIQPVVVGFACVGFYLLYLTYKYLLIWVCDQPDALETGGLYYPKALTTIFTALYIELVFIACLFFLSTSTVGYVGGGIMVLLILITIAFQLWVERKFTHQYMFLDSAGGSWNSESLQKSGTPMSDADLIAQHQRDAEYGAGEHYGNTTGLHTRAFDNPATWKDMPTVWIANDTLGLGPAEVARLRAEHVEASCDYAQMNEKGHVEVERGPPDEAWYEGKTATA